MTDWGVPDWRDAAAYPVKLTDREWWWEFTRRRPDYRHLWENADHVEGSTYRLAADVDDFRLTFQLSLIYDPALRFSDWQLTQYRFAPIGPARVHVKHLPEEPTQREDLAEAMIRQDDLASQDDAAGIFHYSFNLTKPLPEQLSFAADYLFKVQRELYGTKNTPKRRRDKWPLYLRVLDARDGGASYSEMATGLWPGQHTPQPDAQTARDNLVAARALRDNFPI